MTSSEHRPGVWERGRPRPVRLLGEVGRGAAARARRGRRLRRRLGEAHARPAATTSRSDRWYQAPGRRGARASIAYFSPEFGITARPAAVLRRPRHPRRRPPQGRQRPRRPAHRRRPALPRTATSGSRYARGLAAGALPGPRPQRAAASTLLRDADGSPLTVERRAARRPHAARRGLEGAGRPGAAAAARLRHRGQRRRPSARSPTGSTAAAREHRLLQEMLLGIGGVRAVRAYCRHHRAPRARGVPHQRGPRRLPRPRAHPRAHRGRGPRPSTRPLEAARAGTVFTTHTPVPAGIDRFPRELVEQHFGGDNALPGRPGRPDPRARRGGLRRRRPDRVQHGRHGPAAGPARQRRGEAARRRQPRDVRRAVAGLRHRRGADHLGHQRRARPDLGRPRGVRAGRAGHRPRRSPRRRRGWEAVDDGPRRARSGTVRRTLRGQLVDEARAGCKASWLQRGAARRRARLGRRRCSTPTC